MPSIVIFLNDEANKKVKLYMAQNNINSKKKAIQDMLEKLDVDWNGEK